MAPNELLRLPAVIIGPADLARVKRQLESFNETQHQAELRGDKSSADAARLGKLINDVAVLNNCDLHNAEQRETLLTSMEQTLKLAPVVTISFASDPSADFMATIVDWFRTSVNPQTLIRIGLQPNIAAGCIVRTSSKLYDFSLRSRFSEQRSLLVQRLQDITRPKATIQAPTVEAPAPAEGAAA